MVSPCCRSVKYHSPLSLFLCSFAVQEVLYSGCYNWCRPPLVEAVDYAVVCSKHCGVQIRELKELRMHMHPPHLHVAYSALCWITAYLQCILYAVIHDRF